MGSEIVTAALAHTACSLNGRRAAS